MPSGRIVVIGWRPAGIIGSERQRRSLLEPTRKQRSSDPLDLTPPTGGRLADVDGAITHRFNVVGRKDHRLHVRIREPHAIQILGRE